jgi:hypothetical protein
MLYSSFNINYICRFTYFEIDHLIKFYIDGGDGEKEATLHEHTISLNATGDKDSEMEDESDMKKPTGRSHDEHGDRTILPPTRQSRRSKKSSEVLTAETGLVASDGCGNEDQELASTQNTPSSSASSSRYEIITCPY